MKQLIVITGLPACGKTHLAFLLLQTNGVLLDDISKLGIEALKNAIGAEQIIITDPFLCRESERLAAEKQFALLAPDYGVLWIYFENAPEKCLRNVSHRDDGRKVSEFIKQLSKEYHIPNGTKTLEIWQST